MPPTLLRTLLAGLLVVTVAACGGSGAGNKSGDAAAKSGPPIKVLMIGYPDEDGIDAVTGAKTPGIKQLQAAFDKANPTIDMQIVSIPWGEGATGYAPKTEAMMKANEACLYEMPAAPSYGKRGMLVNLDTLIAKDPAFKNVWGDAALESARSWGPDNPKSLFYLPNNTGIRVIHWDSKLFQDWGVEPLSAKPTIEEIETKAAKMTGKNPVTGEDNYGYWYQGKYAVWQFMSIAHAMGASWGSVTADGKLQINWDTPEFLRAMEWFVKMSKYAPKGALAAEGMPQGFLTDKNVVGIIPEGESGYFVSQLIAQPSLATRFRTTYNLKGPDGLGGLNSSSPMAMAASCPNKDQAWTVLKWLAGSPEAEGYYFDSIGRLPVIEGSEKIVTKIANLPDGAAILDQARTSDAVYPWAADQPRFALQAQLEAAIAGKVTPKQALEQAQKETNDWLSKQ
ncbi:extracellular solute-binding protein [Streptosporangiaceae bacterium NEAU-GS5]|nr:extracellular solute-binding protein [Streptosporangiaceae bacterium NEAU-GS5]